MGLNRILNIIKASYEISKRQRFNIMRKAYLVDEFNFDNEDFRVVYDQTLLLSMNIYYAFISIIDYRPQITVDDYYMGLSIDERIFILAHEIAHYKLGHLSKPIKRFNIFKSNIINNSHINKKEIDADIYAVNMIGKEKALQCLQSMRIAFPYNKEIKSRMEYINNHDTVRI